MAGRIPAKKISSQRHTSSPRGTTHDTRPMGPDDALVRQFIWDVISINTHLEEIRSNWARMLDITCPQWLILMAVNDLDLSIGTFVSLTACIAATWLKTDPFIGILMLTGAVAIYALIGVLNRRAGCSTTYTFDRRAAATADFTAVA